MVMAVAAAASAVSRPRDCQKLLTPSPTVQIAPPNRNAFRQSFQSGEFGLFCSNICWYFCLSSFMRISPLREATPMFLLFCAVFLPFIHLTL